MPYGRYPDRVKPFRKWSQDRVDKATINDRATGSKASRYHRQARIRRRRRRKKQED